MVSREVRMWSERLKQEVAFLIYKYREEYGQLGDAKSDYHHAEHFLNMWKNEYDQCGGNYLWAWCIHNIK